MIETHSRLYALCCGEIYVCCLVIARHHVAIHFQLLYYPSDQVMVYIKLSSCCHNFHSLERMATWGQV